MDVSTNNPGSIEINYINHTSFPAETTFTDVTSVMLQAFPDPGYEFIGWIGGIESNENPAFIDVDCTIQVNALFKYSQEVSGRTVYIPHITGGVTGADWSDFLQTDNLSASPTPFLLVLYDVDGEEIYSEVHTVDALTKSVVQLKTFDDRARCGIITYSNPQLKFRTSQQYNPGGGVAQFALTDTLGSSVAFLFSEFNSSLTKKGMALTNMGNEAETVTIEAIGNGITQATASATIQPREKFIKVYQELFPELSFDEFQMIKATTISGRATLGGVVITSDSQLSFLLFTAASPLE